jgi:deoxyribodipyrimidine photolyase-related protein
MIKGCRQGQALGEGGRPNPYTRLHWDSLTWHESVVTKNAPMAMQVKMVARKTDNQEQIVTLRAHNFQRGTVDVAQ